MKLSTLKFANAQTVLSHSKIRKIFITLTFLIFVICDRAFGQKTFELRGKLTDCSDSKPLILGNMFLKQGDSIVQIVSVDDDGQFNFKKLSPGNYQLESYYFYYPIKRQDIAISSDTIVAICISEGNSDKLLTKYKLRNSYTIYYYGMPAYSDEDLNKIGEKYGVQWQNLGCVSDDRFDKYNKVIEKILAHRNGKDWENKFWNEVKQKYDK